MVSAYGFDLRRVPSNLAIGSCKYLCVLRGAVIPRKTYYQDAECGSVNRRTSLSHNFIVDEEADMACN